jgi:cytochrome c
MTMSARRKNTPAVCCLMGSLVAALAGAAWGQAPEPPASDIPALLRDKGCHACHAASEPLLGPAYQAISVMYATGGEVTIDMLAEKIMLGGAGSWGVAPMPRNDRVSREEARAFAAWILEQRPE